MSTYFVSDIHGEYDLFIKLLEEIQFKDEDILYILGDIIDKGNDSIKLLKYISNKKNMFAIMGNHEYYFCEYIKGLIDNTPQCEYHLLLQKIENYFPQHSSHLSESDINYIIDMPYYIENDEFICVHAGLEIIDDKIISMDRQNFKYMLFDRNFKTNDFEPISKTILFGHTPCFYDQPNGKFIKTPKNILYPANQLSSYSKIRLDTGVSYTRMLGALRKEDMKEIYVKE